MKKGKVYLVGAGPGDAGLITVRGHDCLRQADVIIYDRLLDSLLLDAARPDTEKIYVGKAGGRHAKEQKDNAEADDNFGFFVGASANIASSLYASVEASFIDEDSVSGSISWRF